MFSRRMLTKNCAAECLRVAVDAKEPQFGPFMYQQTAPIADLDAVSQSKSDTEVMVGCTDYMGRILPWRLWLCRKRDGSHTHARHRPSAP